MTSGSKALISANSHFASAIIANHFLPGIPNAACQRRKVLALRLLSILHYVLLVLLPHFHQIYKMREHLSHSVLINGHSLIALIDSGSSDSFISQVPQLNSNYKCTPLQRTSLWLSQQ